MQQLLLQDPAIAHLIECEWERQNHEIELIASENFVSEAVLEAVGSILTNKYAEGYPGARYYGGCQFHDEIESLAISRAKELFGAGHANVQPHSGASANFAVYFAALQLGESVLAMQLDHGGHLTHGAKVNFSGKFYHVIPYGVHPETGLIDYTEVRRLAFEHRPKLIVAGASAYARQIDFAQFAEIAREVGAKLFVDMAHIAGLVAAGVHPSPIPFADYVSTTTHKTLRGPRGGMVLCKEEYKKEIDSKVFPGLQGGPLMHVIAGKAVCLHEAMQPSFKQYQMQVVQNAKVLANTLLENGFQLVSGGTDNHLVLVDLRSKGVSGAQAESWLSEVGIVVNKNKIPFDPAKAQVTSGIRLGTPAMTTRGMKETDMQEIGHLIVETLKAQAEPSKVSLLREKTRQLALRFPLYGNRLR